MAQNSSSIPGFLDTKPRWLIFVMGVALGMAIIWSLFTIDFGELGFSSTATANETAVTAPQYDNWQPYSNLGVSGLDTADTYSRYPNWQPYSHLGVPGLENNNPEQIPTYFDWQSYSNLDAPGIDQ